MRHECTSLRCDASCVGRAEFSSDCRNHRCIWMLPTVRELEYWLQAERRRKSPAIRARLSGETQVFVSICRRSHAVSLPLKPYRQLTCGFRGKFIHNGRLITLNDASASALNTVLSRRLSFLRGTRNFRAFTRQKAPVDRSIRSFTCLIAECAINGWD